MASEGSPNSNEAAPHEKEAGLTPEPALLGRRSFLAALAGSAAAVVTVVIAIPYVRFLLYPVFGKGSRNAWSSLGPVDQLVSLTSPVSRLVTIKQEDGWLEAAAKKPVYVTKDAQGRVEVLTAVCPHLGCTVHWNEAEDKFKCPCHGSVFAPDGARLSGPAPRGMDTLPVKVVNGQLMVRYENFRQLIPVKEVLS